MQCACVRTLGGKESALVAVHCLTMSLSESVIFLGQKN